MSLGQTFNPTGTEQTYRPRPPRPKKKRLAPFSIRLSEEERARLAMEAAGAPLGAYIKAKALGSPPVRARRTGLAVEDRVALAKGLALLGRSHLANNLICEAKSIDRTKAPLQSVKPQAESHPVRERPRPRRTGS